jgi:hypothetical protein
MVTTNGSSSYLASVITSRPGYYEAVDVKSFNTPPPLTDKDELADWLKQAYLNAKEEWKHE